MGAKDVDVLLVIAILFLGFPRRRRLTSALLII
jgi:hypothetical protein